MTNHGQNKFDRKRDLAKKWRFELKLNIKISNCWIS